MRNAAILFFSLFLTLSSYGQKHAIKDTIKITRSLSEVIINQSIDKLKLKDTPSSVSIITAESIERNQIFNLNDVTGSVPNFFMPDYGSKLTSPVYIRGIGTKTNEPSVGLYVDYVPYFEKSVFEFDFFDLEHIEVLRGPQGTLYGRNAMAGIINVFTKSPWDHQGTNLRLTAGNYGQYKGGIGVYRKPNEQFAYSIAGNMVHNNGFYKNYFNNEQADELNSYGLRNRLIYKIPEKKLSFENIASMDYSKQNGYPYTTFNQDIKEADTLRYNQVSGYNRLLLSDAFVVNYEAKTFSLRSVTAFQYSDDHQFIDQDFTVDSIYFMDQFQSQSMISQEIIMRSAENKKIDWLVGTHLFAQFFDKQVDVNIYKSTLFYSKTYDNHNYGAGLFMESTIKDLLIKNLDITQGIRFQYESTSLNYFYDRTFKKNYQVMQSDTLYPSLSYVEVLPKIALKYQWKNSKIYFVYSSGFKSGGFNSTFERPEDHKFKAEHSDNTEIGFKSPFFRKRIYAEASLFYINWKDQQISVPVPSGRGAMLTNAGESVSQGAELIISTVPFYGFDITINGGYTDARFTDYIFNDSTDYTKNRIPYVPNYTIGTSLTKSITFSGSSYIKDIKFNLTYKHTGSTYFKPQNDYMEPDYQLFDSKLTINTNKIRIELWSKNLLNSRHNAYYFTSFNTNFVQQAKPLTFGVNLIAKL